LIKKKVKETEELSSWIEHLEELRNRLIISILSWLIASGVSLYFSPGIVRFLAKIAEKSLVFTSPAEPLLTYIKLSLITGIFLSAPVWCFELWQFISPALVKEEKDILLLFLPFIPILFILGMVFGLVVLLPAGVKFLLAFSNDFLQPMLSVGNYISFALNLIIGCGIVFELPVLILITGKIGLISLVSLKRYRKLAILSAFIISAIITPTVDAFTQIALALPLILLFELSILLLKIFKF